MSTKNEEEQQNKKIRNRKLRKKSNLKPYYVTCCRHMDKAVERMDYSFFLKGLTVVMWWGELPQALFQRFLSQKCVCPGGLAAAQFKPTQCLCGRQKHSLRIHLITTTDCIWEILCKFPYIKIQKMNRIYTLSWGFLGSSAGKGYACNTGDRGARSLG